MQVGELRHHARLYRKQESKNQTGETEISYLQYGYAWVSITGQSSDEQELGGRAVQVTTPRIEMRYRSDVAPTDRIVANGKTYEIESLVNPEERGINLIAIAKTIDE